MNLEKGMLLEVLLKCFEYSGLSLELEVPETCKHQFLKVSVWGVEMKGLLWNVFPLLLGSPSCKV